MQILKKLLSPIILPWFTLAAGAVGLILNIWLFMGIDERGLLPASHPAEKLLYLLGAFVLLTIALCVRNLKNKQPYQALYPADALRAIGCVLGAAGIFFSAVTRARISSLDTVSMLVGILAAAALCYIAYLRFRGKTPSFFLFLTVLAYLVLNTVSNSRAWSIEPQMHTYLYPLLASIALMFNTYHLACLASDRGWHSSCVFLNQISLFLCCICMTGENAFFYITMALWLLLDLCMLSPAAEEA